VAENESYFARGLGLREEVKDRLARDYHSGIVDRLRAEGFTLTSGSTTVRLAEEFGFCYGVERAVDYAYQTRQRFPDRDVYITGEIIHNPGVNQRLSDMGIRFLDGSGVGARSQLGRRRPRLMRLRRVRVLPLACVQQVVRERRGG